MSQARRVMRWLSWSFAFVCLLFANVATTQAQVCPPRSTTEKTQAALKYYRRLSLDLRGHAPSYDELKAVETRGYVDDASIDAMLNHSNFVNEMLEYHKDLLTLNITDLRLQTGLRAARYMKTNDKGESPRAGDTVHLAIDSGNRPKQINMRGAQIGCLLTEKATYKNGQLQCKIKGTNTYIACSQAFYERNVLKKKIVAQEGYVLVQPYWESDPSKKVKVCGIAAQTAAMGKYTYKDQSGKTVTKTYNCSTAQHLHTSGNYFHEVACGCGPRLNWCMRTGEGNTAGRFKSMNAELLQAFMMQTLRLLGEVIAKDRPYTDILTSKTAEYNGPIAHFITHATSASNRLALPSRTEYTLPKALAYHQTKTWHRFTRGKLDSGILTMPFYLLKYANNRGRFHRFYNAFMCSEFTPPSPPQQPLGHGCYSKPNLMERCDCMGCHLTVEPGASYWGRWQENAWFPILDAAYKDIDPLCQDPKTAGKNKHCRNLYLYKHKHPDEKPFVGHLLAQVFATPAMKANIKLGPKALVDGQLKSTVNGSSANPIAHCASRKIFTWLVGQDIQKSQSTLHNDLATAFQNANYSVKTLVRAIVTSKEYRRGFDANAP